MDNGYYTVEQISEMLNIHPKTIQRYIREGKLQAVKLGKGWRINEHDLNIFLEKNKGNGDTDKVKPAITASSVIDIAIKDDEDAIRVMNALNYMLNSKPTEFSKTYMQAQHVRHENMVRVTLWGDIHFVSTVLNMIITIRD